LLAFACSILRRIGFLEDSGERIPIVGACGFVRHDFLLLACAITDMRIPRGSADMRI
jgi:hypothetical protein